jgi:SET domain-containing protein
MALSLGFGSLYNHAKDPNASYYLTKENRTITYYALADIPAGQEITINYSGEPGQDFPEWFELRQIDVCA